MNDTLLFFFAAVLVFGVVIFAFIVSRTKGGSSLDVNKFRSQWLSIEQQLQKGNEASYHLTILNGDKLLDQALRQSGFKGETMGERLKSSKAVFGNLNAVWSAHKLRNRIAHEPDVRVSYDDTRRALGAFKQGLKDLGAI